MKKINLITLCILIVFICVSCAKNNNEGINKSSSETNSAKDTSNNEENQAKDRKIEDYTNENGDLDLHREIPANHKDDFAYHINESGNVVIDDYIGTDSLLVFPNEIDGKTVTEIGKLKKNNYVTEIQICNSVKIITDYAFSEWENLRRVSVFVDKEYIGNGAFAECPNLELAVIGEADKLGEGIFRNCKKLKEARIEGDTRILPKDTFAGCVALEDVRLSLGLEAVDEGCFEECDLIGQLYMHKKVNSIKSFPKNAKMIAYKDSYAYKYAQEKGIQIILSDADLY